MTGNIDRREAIKTIGLGTLAFYLGGAMSGESAFGAEAAPVEPYTLPDLPYGYDALEPVLSGEILRIHHDKHHAGYVKGLNATLLKLEEARSKADFGQIKALSRDLAFHCSGHILHTLYWSSMSPKQNNRPQSELRAAINRDFGSVDAFTAQFAAASKKVEGSGWAVLVLEPIGKRLLLLQAEKHQNLAVWGAIPLLVCDVWEHAYYLQYKNNRGEYVDNFMKIIDWPGVRMRYKKAREAEIIYR